MKSVNNKFITVQLAVFCILILSLIIYFNALRTKPSYVIINKYMTLNHCEMKNDLLLDLNSFQDSKEAIFSALKNAHKESRFECNCQVLQGYLSEIKNWKIHYDSIKWKKLKNNNYSLEIKVGEKIVSFLLEIHTDGCIYPVAVNNIDLLL